MTLNRNLANLASAVVSTGGNLATANLSGTITSSQINDITSSQVTTALGFTPYNSTNPSGYITSAGAPVTSVNGQTGAVVTTNLYAIGSVIFAISTSSSNIGNNSTISGAYLLSPSNGTGNSFSGSYVPFSPSNATGNYVNSTSGDFNTTAAYNSRIGVGTWRCLQKVNGTTYANCCGINLTIFSQAVLFVRVS